MDILEVGNGDLTVPEQQTHFAIWTGFKSTLLASTDLTNPTQDTLDTLDILLNKDLIAINQDDFAVPTAHVQRFTDDYDIYAGPLANGDQFVLLVDLSNATNTLSVNLTQLGVSSATAKNLWTGDEEATSGIYSGIVDPHGCIRLRVSNIQNMSIPSPDVAYYEAESGTYAGGASTTGCEVCSGQERAAWMCGDTASFTLTGDQVTLDSWPQPPGS